MEECDASGLDSIHELGSILDEALKEKDVDTDTASDLPSNSDDISTHEGGISSKCLQKCATFPIPTGAEKTAHNTHHLRSLSLPTPKLVSALKGTREKEGLPLKKLSVSWAPDVYDPPPTSTSHYPKRKTQQKLRSSKKHHGKGKQKGKSVRGGGSGGKDKKQYHKMGGKLNKYAANTYSGNDGAMRVSDYGTSLEILDFAVEERHEMGCPESDCGSCYRGKAGSTLHFAYAEAT